MIYLFDDRKPRLDKYFPPKESNLYGDIIQCKIWNEDSMSNLDFIASLDDLEAIFIHGSYTNQIIEEIEEICIQKNIALINFSGNNEDGLLSTNGRGYGKTKDVTFYLNLLPFLNHLKNTNQLNINIIIYGVHYQKNKTIALQELIALTLLNYNSEDDIIINKDEIIRHTKTCLNTSELKDKKEKLISFLQKRTSLLKSEISSQVEKLNKLQ